MYAAGEKIDSVAAALSVKCVSAMWAQFKQLFGAAIKNGTTSQLVEALLVLALGRCSIGLVLLEKVCYIIW